MTYARAARLLEDAGSVAITTHVNPDGDGIGAACALALGLRRLGKRVRLLFADAPAALYDYLPGIDGVSVLDEQAARRRRGVDVLLSCDCGDYSRLGAVAELRRKTLLNIDHHHSNERFGDVNVIEPKTACTCQMAGKLLRRLRVELDADLATCLYTGLVFDTGRFMHSNTSAAVFRFAAQLLGSGIDAAAINRRLSYTRSLHDLRWQRVAIERLRVDRSEPRLAGIGIARAQIRSLGAPEDWGDLVEIPRSLAGVEVAYLLREQNGAVRCSLRANPPYVVGSIAEAFGGGGHAQAAGCTIAGSLAKVRARLLPRLREALRV